MFDKLRVAAEEGYFRNSARETSGAELRLIFFERAIEGLYLRKVNFLTLNAAR